ncbi:hypothetical protein PENANT_c053G01298 [Penicillium antarcticum]|uniref:Uncharacterized protein n=1 Tax=Penicillium antarcticum TaxID=416450 RepID=A0A1V6PQW9_9EURO|nr:uncharacterized protein N7508_004022 [Penicillium antarcticum]KAJ5308643.1 hypothetical protein N7508_004022 [Penicillium antarcticum]OQD79353.1 hypothetical protein PENANT_c053G01298 [Penicillium antarcticum]
MNFREKVKRVFRSKSDGKPKVEYYRRHECPPSKFRGPFDREHQKRLAAWSFDAATADRPHSQDLSLSPCATHCPAPDVLLEESGNGDSQEDMSASDYDAPESSPRAIDSGSQSSTILNPSSYSGSMMTLLNETSIYEIPEDLKDFKAQKESIRYTSPLVRAISPALSPCIMSPRKQKLPFAPEDLTRALIAVQVCA